jgi:hypothetical protein
MFRNAPLLATLLVLAGQTSGLRAQHEAAETHQEGHHFDNGVALFLGGATHVGSDGHASETGIAIGLEYARRVANWLKVGVLAEYASSETQRDYIFALPLFAHLTRGLLVVAAPGVEFASVEEAGHEEEETEFLMRFGTVYEFEINKWAIGPQINADLVDGHWTLVYGVAFGIGF